MEQQKNRLRNWIKFLVGLICLTLFYGLFASGYIPPGIFGEVLAHNQAHEIDASPLFYSEVENMAELEEGVRAMKKKNE